MPRHRRKPRPPGNGVIFCTGRGTHKRRHIRRFGLAVEGGKVVIMWDLREGDPPVAAYREDGGKTLTLPCLTCKRDWRRSEDDLVLIVIALGRAQARTDDDNTPVPVDISRLERA